MTFYVASGVENGARVNEAAAVLAAHGHRRTYDWTGHASVKDTPPARKREVASAEAAGTHTSGATPVLNAFPDTAGGTCAATVSERSPLHP